MPAAPRFFAEIQGARNSRRPKFKASKFKASRDNAHHPPILLRMIRVDA
jgi:hypothetical protein